MGISAGNDHSRVSLEKGKLFLELFRNLEECDSAPHLVTYGLSATENLRILLELLPETRQLLGLCLCSLL